MDVKERKKVVACKSIEAKIQKRWEDAKIFEQDAPTPGSAEWNTPKHFTCFPYPYMNGRLHLGHTFTITKCEFDTGYQRMKGKNAFFPFAFHCTGMPIAAAADKIKNEMKDFGNPPQFPTTVEEVKEEIREIKIVDKSKGKKSKVVAKQGSAKYQWQIMKSLGFQDNEISKFSDYDMWLNYFPPMCRDDLMKMGLKADWRRSFITTDRNLYYDSFVRWQFKHLKEKKKIAYGKRPCIFSPKTDQPCMDHDRASGEGVGPQEYTLIKMKVEELLTSAKYPKLQGKDVYFVAATLRPETMYGQTNCWISPDITYLAVESVSNEVYICTTRSAMNMSFQDILKTVKKIEPIAHIPGLDLMGAKLKAPMTSYDFVYALPMLTIKEGKGTGIVTSVPSDSPDDYAALMDLKNKAPLREKFGITDEMVLPFDPVPIIDVPGFGDLSAVTACLNLKIKSQNDAAKLLEAKDQVYLKGFYEGVLKVGDFAGTQIQKCKDQIRQQLIDTNDALVYREPEKQIMSRAGDECVVAVCDQWYLDYGEKEWRSKIEHCLSKMELYSDDVRNNFERTIAWLKEHACSRTYGLGTRLPWDDYWLIESLSDSTIYMAYYTVSHILQGGTYENGIYQTNFAGKKGSPKGIKPEQMTHEVWDYIFLNGPKPKSQIPNDLLQTMRNEFNYWYPVDVRVSGKDLVQNHLTYFLYNHVAIWEDDETKWPQSVRANGHLLLNGEKMSKSTGNFMTLTQAIEKFSADGMRFALADSGDSVEDANFVDKTADVAVLRLHNWLEFVRDIVAKKPHILLRQGPVNEKLNDRVFDHEMRRAINLTDEAYGKMLYKDALKVGFFELQTVLNKYRELCGMEGMNETLLNKFVDVQTLLLCPICPHIAEEIWEITGKTSFAVQAPFPQIEEYDPILIESSEFLADTVRDARLKLKDRLAPKKGKKEALEIPTNCTIYVAKEYPAWQAACLAVLREGIEKDGVMYENNEIAKKMKSNADVKKYMKKVMPYIQMVKERFEKIGIRALDLQSPFDEMKILNENLEYMAQTLELDGMEVKYSTEGGSVIQENSYPGHPTYTFYRVPTVHMEAVNAQPNSGYFSVFLDIKEGDSARDIKNKISKYQKCNADKVNLYRYESFAASRSIPNMKEIMKGKVEMSDNVVFSINAEAREVYVGKADPVFDRLVYFVN